MYKSFIVGGKRTAIGSFMGELKTVSGPSLSAVASLNLIESLKLNSSYIDSVYMGNVLSCGVGQNPARQAALQAKLNIKTPCCNINKVCASGLKSVTLASLELWAGISSLSLCGGFESMSNSPHFVRPMRGGIRLGDGLIQDSISFDGLTDAYSRSPMGTITEQTASELGIDRTIQDEYAILSYQRTISAIEGGLYERDIAPVELPNKLPFVKDEEPLRFNKDKLLSSRPVFAEKGKKGTITAGNASKINDGAVSILVANQNGLEKTGIKARAEILGFADSEMEPHKFNLAPVEALKKALLHAKINLSEVDFFEVNEAFSVTPIAFMKTLDIGLDRVNLFGGAVSLGHPIGASGSRILLNLINILENKGGKVGAAAICNGGGGATAVIVKLCS